MPASVGPGSRPRPGLQSMVMDRLIDLLTKAYQGEVLGEAFFGRLAERAPDDEQRTKLDALRRLEASTRELLRPMIERHGVVTDDDETLRTGASLADAVASLPWHELLATFAPATQE